LSHTRLWWYFTLNFLSQFVLLSIIIHNAIISMWSIIILASYENHCCLNWWLFPSNDLSCGWISNRGMKMVHGSYHCDQFWPNLGLWMNLTV
jgi:hypothetical protein